MDKRTGMPADNNLASVTVIAENGAMADAYATALSVMGEEKAIAAWVEQSKSASASNREGKTKKTHQANP